MAYRRWNWRQKNWPHFFYDEAKLKSIELSFIQNVGAMFGVMKHLDHQDKEALVIEILSNEAVQSSEIEGEILDRDSVQSSIKQNLGISTVRRKIPPAEFGISEVMVDLYKNYNAPLTHQKLFDWHKMLLNNRQDVEDIGRYRTHEDPMQVVSGRIDKPNIHFEAPPSRDVPDEMEKFLNWFNEIHSSNDNISAIIKAGVTHLYFVSIHPFEDGNGRIARALAEKSIAMSLEQPTLLALSHSIQKNKKDYYQALEENNKDLEITPWLIYFGQLIVHAQKATINQIDFIIEKTKFYDEHKDHLNERQQKVVQRLFDAGPGGFKGGLSADNYAKIAKTSASTATRDLQDLVQKTVLTKQGKLKSTRYYLNLQDFNI